MAIVRDGKFLDSDGTVSSKLLFSCIKEHRKEVEERLSSCKKNIKVAVMGCVVNGPGEAREADIGIAGGKGEGLIFRKGEIIKKVKEEDLVEELIKIIETI